MDRVIDATHVRRLAHTAERIQRDWHAQRHASAMTVEEAIELALLDLHPSTRVASFPDEKLAVELGVESYHNLFGDKVVERERETT